VPQYRGRIITGNVQRQHHVGLKYCSSVRFVTHLLRFPYTTIYRYLFSRASKYYELSKALHFPANGAVLLQYVSTSSPSRRLAV